MFKMVLLQYFRSGIFILSLFVFSVSFAQMIKSGKWQGTIHYKGTDVFFTIEVGYSGGEVPEITFVNGEERITAKGVQLTGDSIFIPLSPFDVEIRAKISAMGMKGIYLKHYRDAKIPFSATYGKPRVPKYQVKPSPVIQPRWSVTLAPNSPYEEQGVGLFEQKGNTVTGTILTLVGDYRYFEGILDGDSIKLYSFDGAHAFAFLGKKTETGWNGKMVYDEGSEKLWEATYDAEAELADPFSMVKLAPEEKPYYDLLGAGQGRDAIDVSKYKGKVLIIQLFGTWCPNSLDATKYLVKWYNENKAKDVAVLASSFEINYSREYGIERLATYQKANQIPYDLVLGGRLSKAAAAMPFPSIKKLEAFPTLVILDKQGYARYVHSYFNGPATGKYYQDFDKKFNEIVESLLSE